MSYAIEASQLTNIQISSIKSMLCLVPEKASTKYDAYDGKVQQNIIFYVLDRNNFYHIPFLFSSSLLQVIPNINNIYPPKPFSFTGKLRPNQVDIESEAWGQLQKWGTSTLGLYPGFGKTILGAKLSAREALLTCVLVHREILTTQWRKTYEDNTDAVTWIVGEKLPRESTLPHTCSVIICMDTRWHLIPPNMRDKIGFLIIDEAHAFCTPTHVNCLLSFHPKYVLAESASLLRDDGMHSMIHSICGTHGVFREIGKDFLVMKIVTNVTPVRKRNRMGGVDWNALVRNVLNDERRNRIITDLVSANLNRKILILTSQVEHAHHLNNLLLNNRIPCDVLCSTKKSYKDATVLVGTVSKIGTGFDQANFCPVYDGRPFDLLILVCSIKKYPMLVQNVGRCFRADQPTVMHLVDNDNIFIGHWYKARKWYLMHGGSISEYNIPNPDAPNATGSEAAVNKWIQNRTKSKQ